MFNNKKEPFSNMTRHVRTCGKKKPLGKKRRKNQWLINQPITTKNQRVKNQAQKKKGQNQWTKNQSENHWGETNRLFFENRNKN